MEYKLLEQIGVDNENIDGAAFNNFVANGEDGIIREVLNECAVYSPTNNAIAINTGEMLVHGFRVKITEAWTHTFTATPTQAVLYQIVARITLNSDRGVAFDILCREKQNLQKTLLFSDEEGVYETDIAQFTHTAAGEVCDIVRSMKVIRFDFEHLEKDATLSIIAIFDTTGTHSNSVSLQNLDGMTSIDWGDGTTDKSLTHTYAEGGEYTCKIYGVKSIGENAFKGRDNAIYDNLKKITILDGITEIGASAFRQNQLLISIDLPNGLKSIGDSAFIGCGALTKIEIPKSEPSIASSAFSYCGSLKRIIVPIESVDYYKQTLSDYATLICSYVTSKEIGDINAALEAILGV